MKPKINLFFVAVMLSIAGCVSPTQQPPQQVTPQDFIINTVLFFLTAFGVYWLLVIRPQQLKEVEQSKFQDSLKKGDDVVTSGGIFGKIVSSAPEAVTVEIAPNCRIRVQWNHISPVPVKKSESSESSKKIDKK